MKIVMLNSGGFDSICLAHVLRDSYPDAEIHALHFLYGARNSEEQMNCVEKVCDKLNMELRVQGIPNFSWTNSSFYEEKSGSHEEECLEYRNLVFLSYAVSYAESIGAKRIYAALLQGTYKDTSKEFIKGLNSAIKGITIYAPFSDFNKYNLINFSAKYGITSDDYISCDHPIGGKPCGKCDTCLELEDVQGLSDSNEPHKVLLTNGWNYLDERFKKGLTETPCKELRLLINNDCQLKCKHCFYSFEETKLPCLTKEELYAALKDAVNVVGVKNIHFSGKEPLINDDIFWYAGQMKRDNLPCTFDVVTNGLTLPRLAPKLKDSGIKMVHLSVDDVLDTNGVRTVHGTTEKALAACNKAGIDVDIFIDLHRSNYNKVAEIISYLAMCYPCVKSFFVRTLKPLGKGSEIPLLTSEQVNEVFLQLEKSAERFKQHHFHFGIGIEYNQVLYKGETLNQLESSISIMDDEFSAYWMPNFVVYFESFCGRYTETITLTPDGFLLGCATEVGNPDYDKTSVGNIRDNSLPKLLEKAREKILKNCNDKFACEGCKFKCSFIS